MVFLFLLIQAATVAIPAAPEIEAAQICLEAIRSPEGRPYIDNDWVENLKSSPLNEAKMHAERVDAEKAIVARWRAHKTHIKQASLDRVCRLMLEAYTDGVLKATADALEREDPQPIPEMP